MDFKIFYIFEQEIIPSRAQDAGIIVFHSDEQQNHGENIFVYHRGSSKVLRAPDHAVCKLSVKEFTKILVLATHI